MQLIIHSLLRILEIVFIEKLLSKKDGLLFHLYIKVGCLCKVVFIKGLVIDSRLSWCSTTRGLVLGSLG